MDVRFLNGNSALGVWCAAPELCQAARGMKASTISRAQPTGCCIRLSSEERIMKEWRSRPVLIIGLVHEDRMEEEKRNRSGVRECAVRGGSITELNTPILRRVTKA